MAAVKQNVNMATPVQELERLAPTEAGDFGRFERFVDEHVIASFLGITARRVLEMARSGKLPAHPLGHERKTWRFRLSEVDGHFSRPAGTLGRATIAAAVPGASRRIGNGNT